MTETGFVLADTHCHLDLSAFDSDLEAVLDRAREEGIKHILVPGIDLNSSRKAVRLAEQYVDVHAAVGVHPHRSATWNNAVADEMRKLAESPAVCAIGETGLDFYRNLAPHDVQRMAFREQLALAADLGLPVVVHSRQALDDVMDTLITWSEELPSKLHGKAGVLHAYSGDLRTASKVCAEGFYVGVAGPVTYRKADQRRKITAQIPIERLLLETDAPYLTPHPHGRKRNEPAYVRVVGQEVSRLFGISETEMAGITSQNATKLFGWNHGN
jgi:TatD DNase family protein